MIRSADNNTDQRGTQGEIPTVARHITEQTGRHLARRALARLTSHTAGRGLAALLFKAGGALSAKAVAIIVLLIIVISVIGGLLLAILGAVGAAFQQTTTVWPVPVDVREDGTYRAGGWAISSRYGWRTNPLTGRPEFHDGIDIVNPTGGCPFGDRCALPAMFDGIVEYVGWDQTGASDPSTYGGGQIVILENGAEDHKTLYAHLQPYRLHVQLQGKIEDDYGRYDDYSDYQTIGRGDLTPDLDSTAIEMWCALEMPGFRPTRSGPGSVTFAYDRPAQCRTSVVWGKRGSNWNGWTADDPAADARGRATLAWQTPMEAGKRAGDVALRFRAHLVPPPPPPTAVPTPGQQPGTDDTPESGLIPSAGLQGLDGNRAIPARLALSGTEQGGLALRWSSPSVAPASHTAKPHQCEPYANGWRCVWLLADIPAGDEEYVQVVDYVNNKGRTTSRDMAFQLALTPTSTVVADPETTPSTPASNELSTLTPTLHPPPMLVVSMVASQSEVPIGGRFSVSVGVWNDVDTPVSIPVTIQGGQGVIVLDSSASGADSCSHNGSVATCTVRPGMAMPATMSVTFQVMPDAPMNGQVNITASVSEGDRAASDSIVIMFAGYAVTPGPWPPPTSVPTAIPPTPVWAWPTSDPNATALPTTTPTPLPPGEGPGDSPLNCAPQPLEQLAGVMNAAGQTHHVRLIAPAAARFQEVRAEILARTGQDPLARLADALRDPEFRSSKPGVARMSWHMTGRAIDVNTGYPWRRVREGSFWRLYLGETDVTAIFEARGFSRIPDRDDSTEWWHYEYRADGISWASAMVQVWPIGRLQAAFPEVAWASIGCQNEALSDTTIVPIADGLDMCVAGAPSYSSAVEELSGCGPPVRAGDRVFQLDSTIGFIGLTGQTTGPHLHLGLMVKSYDGMYHQTDICTSDWLTGGVAEEGASCWTEMADPLAFLPLAPPPHETVEEVDLPAVGTPTTIIPEGAPWQLPPPDYPGSLMTEPAPEATPSGQYWSPFQDGGQYGGGGVIEWFVGTTCGAWSGFSWCPVL